MGRTLQKYLRFYMGGYDFSDYAETIGPLDWEFKEEGMPIWTDVIRGVLPGIASMSPGQFKGLFDNTATVGLHTVRSASPGSAFVVSIPFGDLAAPAQGDPVYTGRFAMRNYKGDPAAGMVAAMIDFGQWDVANMSAYQKPWGWLLHANAAATGANTAVGIDDWGAATTKGGYMTYHVLDGDGTATLKVQHAATNADVNFSDLTGATSGVIDCSARGSGIAECAVTATVNRYLRWQILLGTATTVTFVLSFVRAH